MSKNEKVLDIDLEGIITENEHMKEGAEEYERVMKIAMQISEEITSALVKEIVKATETGKKDNIFTFTTAIAATAKTLTNLVSYMYDTEEELLEVIRKSRETVVDMIIPSILNPQPCGKCLDCRRGKPCTNPNMDTELLQTKTLPILCAEILEYDLWNKMMYIYTEERDLFNQEE